MTGKWSFIYFILEPTLPVPVSPYHISDDIYSVLKYLVLIESAFVLNLAACFAY